jgi:TolB protein
LNGNIVIFNSVTGITREVTSDGRSTEPAWSPDGKRIAFVRYRVGEEDGIYVMNADGTGVTRVTGPGFGGPTWSPQGDALAFSGASSSCAAAQPCSAIYLQKLSEGSVMRWVASGFSPAWSPDGSRIAFVGHMLINDEDHYSLRLVNPDGSGLKEIAQAGWVYSDRPTWSPDGTLIAFSLWGHIHAIRADGTGQTQLTTSQSALPRGLAWSPDGVRIAYEYGGTIMEVSVHGGEPTPLTLGYSPSWRP